MGRINLLFLQHLVEECKRVGPLQGHAAVHDVQQATFSEEAKVAVGQSLRQLAQCLREFDMYEACGEGFAEPTEYIRQMLTVTLEEGAALKAWTYLYNWPVDRLPRITSGRFLEE